MKNPVFLLFILGFNSCIIIEEITLCNYVFVNNTNHSIELISESFDFNLGDYHNAESGVIVPYDSLILNYEIDGISRSVDSIPFYYLDSIAIKIDNTDTIIHYKDNRNGLENNIFDVKNWSGGMIDEGRHHQSFSFRYVFQD